MTTIRKRLLIDAALSVFLIVEMFIQYTGVFLHEVIGFAFLATIAVHLIIERKWMAMAIKRLRTGKARKGVTAKAIIAGLLLVALLGLATSSIMISTIIAATGVSLAALNPGGIWYTVHTVSAYALCVFVIVHVLSHWALVAQACRIPYDPSRRAAISTGVNALAAVGAVAIGIAGANALNLVPGQASASTASDSAQGNAAPAASTTPSGDAVVVERRSKGSKGAASSGSAPSGSSGSAPAGSSGSASGSGSSSSNGSAAGICTLCHKGCSLSDPKCNKPVQAGLV